MPGLVGLTAGGTSPVDLEAAALRMQALNTHPEHNVAEPVWSDGRVAVARSRVVYSTETSQPACVGGRVVWLDGEVANRDDLTAGLASCERTSARAVLQAHGARSDGAGLADLDGAFAAVAYDRDAGTLTLISDRFGLRFLYWTVSDRRLLWASTLGALVGCPGFTPIVDRETVGQILTVEHPIGDRSLLAGVRLLAPGTALTFDLANATLDERRYWWWDRIRPLGRVPIGEAADELGRRLRRAVDRRVPAGERVLVSLSGGLDSRALFAAAEQAPAAAVTFGRARSLDVAIARRVAEKRAVPHRVVTISAANWLTPRIEGVWWTDGHLDIADLHGMEDPSVYADGFSAYLDGYGGDCILGGMYMGDASTFDRFSPELVARRMHCEPGLLGDLTPWENLGRSDYYLLENRARRMNNAGTRFVETVVDSRKPFLANDVVDFVFGLPDAVRSRCRLYRRTLVRTFPDYYRGLPWASLGVPISWPRGVRRLGKAACRWGLPAGETRAVGVPGHHLRSYADYPGWLRRAPARAAVDRLLRDPGALYPEYTSRDAALRLWERHLAGETLDWEVGTRVSLEVWLQQLYHGRLRRTGADEGSLDGATHDLDALLGQA